MACKQIKYSAGGERVMVIGTSNPIVFICDTKTNKRLKQLEFGRSITDVAISPDGSQIAFDDELGMKIIDVSTGRRIGREIIPYNNNLSACRYHSTPRLAWSPNGQFYPP